MEDEAAQQMVVDYLAFREVWAESDTFEDDVEAVIAATLTSEPQPSWALLTEAVAARSGSLAARLIVGSIQSPQLLDKLATEIGERDEPDDALESLRRLVSRLTVRCRRAISLAFNGSNSVQNHFIKSAESADGDLVAVEIAFQLLEGHSEVFLSPDRAKVLIQQLSKLLKRYESAGPNSNRSIGFNSKEQVSATTNGDRNEETEEVPIGFQVPSSAKSS